MDSQDKRHPKPEDYTVAWVCALPLEMAVARVMRDKHHPAIMQQASDQNVYTLGSISGHNQLSWLICDKPSLRLRFGLMVGIGGGVPSQGADIRLGDVVVSIPIANSSGVVQYDYGKAARDGYFKITRHLNKPPSILLAAVSKMRSESMLGSQCRRPDTDWLFYSNYEHETPEGRSNCSACDQANLVYREPRETDEPQIHYGLIASGNQVMKDATKRDRLATELGVYCFEMEAAGLMDQLPCLVIRGICDYCDSHKHKQWQGYVALSAAVYAKLLLGIVPSDNRGRKGSRKTELTTEEKACLNSLFIRNPNDDNNELKRRKGPRVPGTCDWILKTEMFQAWLSQTPPQDHGNHGNPGILWLYGNPGTGKSTMAITIVEEFPEHSSFPDKERSLAYFFCDSGTEDRRTATALLRAIIYQLVSQRLELIDHVLPKYEMVKERLLGSFDALWSILMEISRNKIGGKKYVIIDALDECEQDSQLTFLTQIAQTFQSEAAKQGGPGIFFLITSRPYPEIPVTAKVSSIIAEKAKGTFLWVSIACDELARTRSRDAVKGLEALPRGLHSLCQNLLDSAMLHADHDRDTLLLMLSFVAIAQRALGIGELSDACELYVEEDEESRLAFTKEDIEMCRLMLVVENGYVRLLHNSVRDFLVQSPGSGLMSEPAAHAVLATRCIAYFLDSLRRDGAAERQMRDQKFEFVEFCEKQDIKLFFLPPHTSHFLQPLDVGVSMPLNIGILNL
ncbi:nucleoside phosphorylase domain-containing protein [Aspergillus heterothallicus]